MASFTFSRKGMFYDVVSPVNEHFPEIDDRHYITFPDWVKIEGDELHRLLKFTEELDFEGGLEPCWDVEWADYLDMGCVDELHWRHLADDQEAITLMQEWNLDETRVYEFFRVPVEWHEEGCCWIRRRTANVVPANATAIHEHASSTTDVLSQLPGE